MSDEIERGTFDYLKSFPEGNRAHKFLPKRQIIETSKPETVRAAYERWISRKKPPFVRKSLERDYRQAFNKNILPYMGEMELNAVILETLESFRLHLIEDRKLTIKTARNIIDGALQPMFRDAGRRIERNPFNDVPSNWVASTEKEGT